jgi:hypothetical protein
MKFLIVPWLMVSCWANGISEANVGDIICLQMHASNGVENIDLACRSLNNWYHDDSQNIEYITINLTNSLIIAGLSSIPTELYGKFKILCPRTDCSIFTGGFGYVVIPFIDEVQVQSPDFTGTKTDARKFEFSFKMVFNDPTLATAESHVYRIDFWDCEWGQCELDEYDKKTVKRGEAIMTVNYTP